MPKRLIAGAMAVAMTAVSVNWDFGGTSLFGADANAEDGSLADNWIFREANNADTYADRISGNTVFLDWNDPALRGIISKNIYSDYKLTAQIMKDTASSYTSIQLGLPYDDRLDMWENLNGGSFIGGTGLQVAISDTKAVIGLVNGVENTDTTEVEVALNGINTLSGYVDIEVVAKDNVYDITIGSQHIATVTLDESSIQYGRMEVRREWVNGVLVPAYADSDVAYYTSGKITANGTDTYFSNKAVAVINPETGDGTVGFSTRAQGFWVSNPLVTEITDSGEQIEDGEPVLGLDGTYYIRNVYSGKYLDVAASTEGANIQQSAYTGEADQQFRLVSRGEGYYEILTGATGFTMAVDVDGWSTEDGGNIHQWTYNGLDCQQFMIVKSDYYYSIRTKVTENTKAFDVEGPSTNDGANIHQWSAYGGTSQQWALVPVVSGDKEIKNTVFTGESTGSGWDQVVTVSTTRSGGSFDSSGVKADGWFYAEYSGTEGELELIVQSWSGANNWGKVKPVETGAVNGRYYAKFSYADCAAALGTEDFAGMLDRVYVGALHDSLTVYELSYVTIDDTEEEKPQPDPAPETDGKSVAGLDGIYYIRNVNSGRYLDVEGISNDNGANIHLWGFTSANNQRYKLVDDGNGYYVIYTGVTDYEKAVDIYASSADNGANVNQWEYNGSDCQKYEIVEHNGYYALKTKISDSTKAVSVENGGTADGANIIQQDFSGATSQLWILEPVYDFAVIDDSVDFLTENNLISGGSVKNDCIEVLTNIMGSESAANALYSECCSGEPTQKTFLTMLLKAMGHDANTDTAMRKAQAVGIVKNVPSSSYGDVELDSETLAAYVYNALSAKCADGVVLGIKLGVTTDKQGLNVNLTAQNSSSYVSGSNAVAVSDGGIGRVSTADSYQHYTLTADVRAEQLNGFAMGFRLNNPSHTMNESGLWIQFVDNTVRLISGGRTVYAETPMGLFNVTQGVKMKVVDNGESINIFSVIGDAEIPFFEIRFVDNYAVAYVRGHIVHSVPATGIANSGYISFASASGRVEYNNIQMTSADPVLNLNTEYPEVGEGKYFTATENFDDGMYDYNLFMGTGGTMAVRDGRLVFSAGRENVFSTVMRVEDGVIEADVLPGSGDVQFQIGTSSNMSAGYYYCGMRIIVKSGWIELYHNTGNMDEQSPVGNDLVRYHGMDATQGYSARLSLVNGVLSFSMKGLNDTQYREVLRAVTSVSSIDGREYFSVLDGSFSYEESHYDKLMREFGYIRITSEHNAVIDNVRISGKGYLPYEQMEILPAPEPDAGEKFEVDDFETVVGIGYLPYFTRYKYGTRPSVENLLPAVIEASRLSVVAREEAFNNLYWGYAWWAEPAQGMYCSRDVWAAKKNLEMIGAAGIDFIFVDHTNFNGGSTPDDIMNNIEIILEAALELEAEGKPCPKICFWNNVRNEPSWERGGYEDTAREIWQVFIANPRYKNLWVYYHDKILMMYTFGQPMSYLGMKDVAEIREMWTNSNVENTWSFHQDPPYMADRAGLDAEGNIEQINVLPYGKTTYNGNVSDLENTVNNGTGGREGGLYYKRYWERAFELRPKFVMIWAYNHWDVNFKRPESSGQTYWGDNFNMEYSGGIEPIKNNFVYKGVRYAGDSYYNWTKEYIRAYKAGEGIPQNLYVNP